MNALTDKNRLSVINPLLSEEWSYDKNKGLMPESVCCNSRIFVWWKCKICSYEWRAKIVDRNYGHKKCPRHRSVGYGFPNLLREWNYPKNKGMDPYLIISGSPKIVWWICERGHEWKAKIADRSRGEKNCRSCMSLSTTHPHLIKEWNYQKNKNLNPDIITYGSKENSVWWKCKRCGHEWTARLYQRVLGGDNCPRCQSLGILNPKLSKEWHPTKNGKITPYDVFPSSSKKAWWKCGICGHEWIAYIHSRNKGHLCPNHRKVILLDGTCCDSYVEAYYYLKYKQSGVKFIHHKKYGGQMGKCISDFYIKEQNKWVEVTGYHDGVKNYFSYLRKIAKKKKYVEKVLGEEFEFISRQLTRKQKQYVLNNMKHYVPEQNKENKSEKEK